MKKQCKNMPEGSTNENGIQKLTNFYCFQKAHINV
jgi:hypothetical protein